MNTPNQTWQIFFTAKEKAELRRVPLVPVTPGTVLLRTTWTMVSTGTETTVYGRRFAEGTAWDSWAQYPFAAGYSHVGVVEALGEGVTGLKIGDRVATTGPHAQYLVVPHDTGLYPIPQAVTDRDATWAVIAQIAQNGVRATDPQLGDDVAIIGLGPIGQLLLQFARLTGPRRLIAIDPVQQRLQWAQRHGASDVLQIAADAALEPVQKINGGRLCDVVYDVTGRHDVFMAAQRLLRRRGVLSLVGDTGFPGEQRLSSEVMGKSLRIVASHATCTPAQASDFAYWTRPNMIQLFFDYVTDGRMKVADLNTHESSPRDCQAFYQLLLNDRSSTMGCHFNWSQLD